VMMRLPGEPASMIPVCAFCILSQGCASQDLDLWAVENSRGCDDWILVATPQGSQNLLDLPGMLDGDWLTALPTWTWQMDLANSMNGFKRVVPRS
jgi:hypothetical protein